MEIGKGTSGSIRRTQGKDYKSTSTSFTQKRRKIQGGNGRIRTCHWRSTFPRARREMETHCIFIKNNATSRMELRNLQQGTIGNRRGLGKMATIFAGCSRDIRDMDGSRKPEVLSRTPQVKRTTGQMVLEIARLRLYPMTYSGKNKYKSRYSIKERSGRHKRG